MKDLVIRLLVAYAKTSPDKHKWARYCEDISTLVCQCPVIDDSNEPTLYTKDIDDILGLIKSCTTAEVAHGLQS